MITLTYYCNKETVARFVRGLLVYSEIDFASITIIGPEKSEEFSVSIVIDTSLEDTVKEMARICLEQQPSTSTLSIPAG